jgi:Recombination endonuclease VII
MVEKLCVQCKERPMAYPKSNIHWCKVCSEEVRRARYDPAKMRDENLQQNYRGFSSQDYDALFLEQGGSCAVCGRQQRRHLHVDHDHATGVVRGLLCNDCNAALGHLRDSPGTIRRLLQYISQYVKEG